MPVTLPQVPMTSPDCRNLLHHGDRYECQLGGECQQASKDITELDSCTRGFVRALRKGEALNLQPVKGKCLNLGNATGDLVKCAEGCKGVQLKVFGCSVHGKCTIEKFGEGVAHKCKDCADYRGEKFIQVRSTSGGIGDMLMAMCIAEGIKKQTGLNAKLVCSKNGHEWVKLFDGAAPVLTHSLDSPVLTCEFDSIAYRMRPKELSHWEYWQTVFGTRVVLPLPKPLPLAATAKAVQFVGSIAICPIAAWQDRTWPLDRWLAVERTLISMGYKCVILHNDAGRIARFTSPKLVNESAVNVAAVMQACACVVGNDSGLAHVAGLLRRPAIGICARPPSSPPNPLGLYPNTLQLGGLEGLESVTYTMVVNAILGKV